MTRGRCRTVAAMFAAVGLVGSIAAQSQSPAQRFPQAVRLVTVSAHSVQGYLGVSFHEVSDEQIATLPIRDARGVEITQVDHDGPAGKAGIREHDLLLQLNGQSIEGVEHLRRMLREIPAGRPVTLTLSRDGQIQTVNAVLANREALERQAWDQHIPVPDPGQNSTGNIRPDQSDRASNQRSSGGMGFFAGGAASASSLGSRSADHNLVSSTVLSSSYTGAALESLGPQLADFFGATDGNGLLVRSIETNSPAAVAGLKAGDVVIRVNQVAILAGGDWLRLVHESKGRPVQVTILREKKEQTLTLVPDAKRRSGVVLPPLPFDPAVLSARS